MMEVRTGAGRGHVRWKEGRLFRAGCVAWNLGGCEIEDEKGEEAGWLVVTKGARRERVVSRHNKMY